MQPQPHLVCRRWYDYCVCWRSCLPSHIIMLGLASRSLWHSPLSAFDMEQFMVGWSGFSLWNQHASRFYEEQDEVIQLKVQLFIINYFGCWVESPTLYAWELFDCSRIHSYVKRCYETNVEAIRRRFEASQEKMRTARPKAPGLCAEWNLTSGKSLCICSHVRTSNISFSYLIFSFQLTWIYIVCVRANNICSISFNCKVQLRHCRHGAEYRPKYISHKMERLLDSHCLVLLDKDVSSTWRKVEGMEQWHISFLRRTRRYGRVTNPIGCPFIIDVVRFSRRHFM